METVKILVTGGAGFIGTNLVNELNSRGHEVTALDLYNTDRDNYIRADVRNFRQLERVFDKQKFDYVYHLAAEYGRWNGEDYYENLWQTNVVGTKHVLRLQEKLKFCMIFFSSAEVYGDYEGIMTEDVMVNNPIKDTYQMNDYAVTKWAGELMCMNSAKMFGTETVRVRPVNCYGPNEHYNPYSIISSITSWSSWINPNVLSTMLFLTSISTSSPSFKSSSSSGLKTRLS